MSNCVCGYPQSRHVGESLRCPGTVRDHFRTMDLPAGRTCADCANLKRFCGPIIGYKGTETRCDFHPIRFVSIPGMNALIQGEDAPPMAKGSGK